MATKKAKKCKKAAMVDLDEWLTDLCAVLRSANDNELMDHRLGDVAWAAAILCNECALSFDNDQPRVRVIDLPEINDDVLDPAWCREAEKVLKLLDPANDAMSPLFGVYCLLGFLARELEIDAKWARRDMKRAA